MSQNLIDKESLKLFRLRRFVSPWVCVFLIASIFWHIPASAESNEGLHLRKDSAVDNFTLSWSGRAGHTYFIEYSKDLKRWEWAIFYRKSLVDGPMEWDFLSTEKQAFFRLQFSNDPNSALLVDADADGLSDLGESLFGTDLNNFDSDGDGMPDGWEIAYGYGLNPLDPTDAGLDFDLDALNNLTEFLIGTDPTNPDSDFDGMPDGWEVTYGLDPLDSDDSGTDLDGDGIVNKDEFDLGSDPTDISDPNPLTTMQSSPADGEVDITVTRETIVRFSNALAPNNTMDDAVVFAEFGGQKLAARIQVSADQDTVTLFYDAPLPPSARVRVTLNGDQLTDLFGRLVDADGDGTPGGIATIDFDTLTLTVVEGTSICGRVFASELVQMNGVGEWVNEPLEGVTITVDGAEDTLFAVTDELGDFRLEPAPVGKFFVHINGHTASNGVPSGAYYANVGKAWKSVPGEETTVGEIFLPLVIDGTLQPVSETEDTTIQFPPFVLAENPDFAGVSITVPAGSLFADDGTTGGSVGIAPVDPNRLPGTLPDELNFPLVITVQTDGATNFDEPAPICFPNLPDPDTGEVLAPGAKTGLWSFNHDAARWEVVGSMTVSADGALICSDPGVGILAPGWHGVAPGTPAGGGGYSPYGFMSASIRTSLGQKFASPRYRKIALNGMPLSDEKPQDVAETDEAREETYIDSMNLSLVHQISDIYIPVPGSNDLTLSVKRNAIGESWRPGRVLLPPDNSYDRPFGACWTSNLTSNVRVEMLRGNAATNGNYECVVYVTDETGSSHRFLVTTSNQNLSGILPSGAIFTPFPNASHELETLQSTLKWEDTPQGRKLVFKKKFGTRLTFSPGPFFLQPNTFNTQYTTPSGATVLTQATQEGFVYRLEKAEDRFGNFLEYEYDGNSTIPSEIKVNGSSELKISLQSEDGRITQITDPRGNTTRYEYNQSMTQLLRVIKSPDSGGQSPTTHYTYSSEDEADTTPALLLGGAPPVPASHINISSIQNERGNTYQFHYSFDDKHFLYVNYADSGGRTFNGWYQLHGLPRWINKVMLPDTAMGQGGETVFGNNTYIATQHDGGLRSDSKISTYVIDAEGKQRTYDFTRPRMFDIFEQERPFDPDNTNLQAPTKLITFDDFIITYPGGLTESLQYDYEITNAPVCKTDISGNNTYFKYQDRSYSYNIHGSRDMMLYYPEPTSQVNAINRERQFSYGPYRMMTSQTDEESRRTRTLVDSLGRRYRTLIYNEGSALVQQMDYEYDTDFTNVVIRETVQNLNPVGAWDVDLITDYTIYKPTNRPAGNESPYGLIKEMIVDKGGLNLVTAYEYDANGNRIAETDPRGYTTYFVYDSLNRLTDTVYPPATGPDDVSAPRKTTLYDLKGNVITEIDENGNQRLFEYDGLDRVVTTAIDLNGNGSIDYEDDTTGDVNEDGSIASLDIVERTIYNNVSSKIASIDPNGTVSRFEYDDLHRLAELRVLVADNPSLPNDLITTYAYNPELNPGSSAFDADNFKPTRIVDPRGFITEVHYDELYRPVKTFAQYQKNPEKYAVTETHYDGVGNPVATVAYYDYSGSIESFTGAELAEDYTFVSTGTYHDPLVGQVTVAGFDALNRPIRVINPDSTEVAMRYTATGLKYEVVDELGRVTKTEFDAAGRPVQLIQPLVDNGYGINQRPVIEAEYDANGNMRKTTNPLGFTWEYRYDERNRKTHEIHPAVSYVDETGDWQATAKHPINLTAYDEVGNVIATATPREFEDFYYDGVTAPTWTDVDDGFVSYTRYDRANRPIAVVSPPVTLADDTQVYPAGMTLYDNSSNILEQQQGFIDKTLDPANAAITSVRTNVINTYDPLNRLVKTVQDLDDDGVESAGDIVVYNEYDNNGNRTAVIDGKLQTTEFEYDGLGRNIETRNPSLTPLTSYVPYAEGRTDAANPKRMGYNAIYEISRTDEAGKVTTYKYDARNRLDTVDYGDDGIIDRDYGYDPVGNILSVAELDAKADVAYTYDALNRIDTETSSGVVHNYDYDLAGNRLSANYGDGNGGIRLTLTSTYDALNRTKAMSENGRVSTYRYDLAGNIREKGQPNGDTIRKSLDRLNRALTIYGPEGSDTQLLYQYDKAYDLYANLAEIEETYPSADSYLDDRTIVNRYDVVNRLLEEAIVTGSDTVLTTYTYDKAHNRATKQIEENSVIKEDHIYTFNTRNQIDSFVDAVSGVPKTVSYTYDFNGNRETRTEGLEATTYYYDYENRLLNVSIDEDGDTGVDRLYAYVYDYRTRRVERDESNAGGSSTRIVFSNGLSVQEYDDTAPTPSVEYIRGSDYGGGIGGILYTVRSGAASFNHYNSRGDVVAKTDDTGALTYQAAYEAFGRHGDTLSSQEWGTNPDRQQANTKDEDPTGLLNEGFRYRDLETGVFITRDPLGFADGPNMYAYVMQNPWTRFDPFGLQDKDSGEVDKEAKSQAKNETKRQHAFGPRALIDYSLNHGTNAEKAQARIAAQAYAADVQNAADTIADLADLNPIMALFSAVSGESASGRSLSGAERGLNALSALPVAGFAIKSIRFASKTAKQSKLARVAKVSASALESAAGASSKAASTTTKAANRGQGWFDNVARNATRNADSNKLVLGKFLEDGKSYTKVAAHYKASYFKVDSWGQITKGLSQDEIWRINESFLRQQIQQGKQIILSHNPATATGFFAKEVGYLESLGYKFVQENWVWKAVR